jgi:hypothetical protein
MPMLGMLILLAAAAQDIPDSQLEWRPRLGPECGGLPDPAPKRLSSEGRLAFRSSVPVFSIGSEAHGPAFPAGRRRGVRA